MRFVCDTEGERPTTDAIENDSAFCIDTGNTYIRTAGVWVISFASLLDGVSTTADVPDSTNKRYVTDAQAAVLGNTSGTNTGDQSSIAGITGTLAQFNAALTGADFATGGGTVTGASSGTNTGDQSLAAYATTAAVAAGYQPLDTQLTSLAGLAYAGNALKVVAVNAGETGFEMASNSAAVAWGGVTGTLSNQSDLQTALNGKVATTITVNGQALSGNVAVTAADVGLGSANNTSDAGKPVSTAQQTALDLKANLASPTLSGTPSLPTGTTATTQAALDSSTKLATTAFAQAINNNASYITILSAAGSHIAARVAGTYGMGYADPLAISGTGTLYALAVIAINSADYPTINGITTKLRIRGQIACNDVAPTGNFTFGLYPITRPATSGGAGLNIYTLGTVVSGSNGATVSAPAADSHSNLVGADFALPANGLYVIGVVTTATVATSAHMHFTAQLQLRNA